MKRRPRTKSTAATENFHRAKFRVIRARRLQDNALICHKLTHDSSKKFDENCHSPLIYNKNSTEMYTLLLISETT